MKKIETILHPVRFRIIQRFLDGQVKTAKELAKEVKDIPQATLYRQLDALVKAEVLVITEENQIRGTVEKVYALNNSSATMTKEDVKDLTKEEHLQYFLFFTAQLAKDFDAYLSQDDIDFERDGVGYRQVGLHLTDDEFMDFVKDMGKVVEKYIHNQPNPNRTKRIVSTVVIPENKGGIENDEK
ncbi:DNA-binding PadR family transcriptional regulator [Salirhabdus euzebyi]|uniref:DNA-binding PadR family transcriptional regulator n=1 Tax=Salirhabdus euzebyi TaxID=394506 RepID=A0A841PS95_9BACI|nr:helix-turn-helix domain-containing protein [Salirhabdus euzebyi]MBB6451679.1 DNA-binding PadR family transcriptional regulator [Salirhabdus euzebyi]